MRTPGTPAAKAGRPDDGAGLEVLLEHFLEQLTAELATSTGTVRDTGARAVALRPGASSQPTSSPGALVGFSLVESTGGASAQLVLRDGTDSTGAVLAIVTLGPGESVRDWFGPSGVGFGRGVFVDPVAGQVDGAVYLRAVE